MKIKRILASLLFIILGNSALTQSEAPGGRLSVPIYPDASGGRDHLILIPELAAATLDGGMVTIPFTLKNDSDRTAKILCTGQLIDGLAIVDQTGEKRFIQDLHGSLSHFQKSGRVFQITLNPGEATPCFSSVYSVETLRNVIGSKIFGVLSGSIANPNKTFRSYSASFLVPPALTTPPWNDLGEQNYLSITPDLTKISFYGGSLGSMFAKGKDADAAYADLIKNGWTEKVFVPIILKNNSSQDVVAANDDIVFYIAGNENDKNKMMRDERWIYQKISSPVLKPGESCESTGRDYIILSWLYRRGYKPGDKIIAAVGGRIPGTNNIFECYSAPFELPPLPKGQSPREQAREDEINAEMEGHHPTTSSQSELPTSPVARSTTSLAAKSAGQAALQPSVEPEPEALHQRANWAWYVAGAALLAGLALFFVKRSRRK